MEEGMRCTACGEHVLNCDASVLPTDPDDPRQYHEDCAPEGWATSGAYCVVED